MRPHSLGRMCQCFDLLTFEAMSRIMDSLTSTYRVLEEEERTIHRNSQETFTYNS